MFIFQIVPKVFPVVDGVGDYALSLAHKLRGDFGIETHFIVADLNWSGSNQVDGFPISQLTAHTSSDLASLLDKISETPASVLLHYVSYGYARRGCPFWLVKGLERYKAARPAMKLVNMFHETYGSGPPYYGSDPPWTSAFWLSPLQKNCASRLVILSDYSVTSREKFKQQLHRLSQCQDRISVLPVFSNVGEAQQVPLIEDRPRRLVLFGSRNSRARVYEQFPNAIEETCQILEIEEIYDIGPATGLNISNNGIPVVSTGEIPASEVGEILLTARAGILNYHPEYLAKSGVYAAFCAHGTIPIVAFLNAGQFDAMDGLQAGKHYCASDSLNKDLCLETKQAIADNAYSWYQTHNLSMQAQIFATHLLNKEAIARYKIEQIHISKS